MPLRIKKNRYKAKNILKKKEKFSNGLKFCNDEAADQDEWYN